MFFNLLAHITTRHQDSKDDEEKGEKELGFGSGVGGLLILSRATGTTSWHPSSDNIGHGCACGRLHDARWKTTRDGLVRALCMQGPSA